MRTVKLVAILSSVLMFGANVAFADVNYNKEIHNQHFAAKRPYQQVLPSSAYAKADQWEGASFTESASQKGAKQINLHLLGKRPHSL